VTNIEPLGDRVLVRPEEPEQKTASGILIPPKSQEESQQGTIIAVGKECKDLKVGDIVLYSRYGTTKIKIQGEDLLLMRVDDMLARVNAKKS
jgi:chaperonin GroES